MCSCQGSGSLKEPEEESEGERRRDIRSMEDEVIKAKSDIAKDIEEDTISGDNSEGVPPVPIPNTEVKPFSVDGTWLETARESRSSPDSNNTRRMASVFFMLKSYYIMKTGPGFRRIPSCNQSWFSLLLQNII